MKEAIDLNPEIFRKFRAGKVIKEHNKDIVGMDFSNDGTLLYSADSMTLNVFETHKGKLNKKLFMKNHQIQQLTHTHHNSAVLVATKKSNQIFYWSIHENKVIKLFEGHRDTITNLIMCPKDDKFISTSQDNTLRLWDLSSNSKDCICVLDVSKENISAFPVASFDPTGLIFGVTWSQQPKDKPYARVCLFDKQKCAEGPFTDWKLQNYSQIKIMKFSTCGELILLGTADNLIILLDAYEGDEKYKLTSFINEASIIECSFTPDSKYIISGSENGVIHVWSIDGKEVVQLKSHMEKVFYVKFSPTNCMLASGGRNIVFWVPQLQNSG